MNSDDPIYVAGHTGLVGSAIVRRLTGQGYTNLQLRRHNELDLTDPHAVNAFFAECRPAYVFVAAAKVGGIVANATWPADFIAINLAIALNVIRAAHQFGTRKLLFLSSSCVYPRLAPQPMREEYLLTGSLESTNEPYAVAKIAGMKLCEAFRRQHGAQFVSVLPTNVYGPHDNFDPETSHVLPALIRKFHDAKAAGAPIVNLWGSGTPRREFIHADDLADACVLIMRNYNAESPVNIGVGSDITIAELAEMVRRIVGYDGAISFDQLHPDGTPRKLLDSGRLEQLGWTPRIHLEAGIRSVYEWYVSALS